MYRLLKFAMTVLNEFINEHNTLFNVVPLLLGQSRDFPLHDCPIDGEVTLKHEDMKSALLA